MSRPTCDTVIVMRARPNVDREDAARRAGADVLAEAEDAAARRHEVARTFGEGRREVREGRGIGAGERAGGRRGRGRPGAGIGAAHSKRWKPTTCDASRTWSSSFRWGSTRQISGLGNGVCRKKETSAVRRPSLLLQRGPNSISWKLWTHTMSPGRRNSRTTEAKPAFTFS